MLHIHTVAADRNACVSNPCLNKGTCERKGNNYHCKCGPGHAGRICESKTVDVVLCSAFVIYNRRKRRHCSADCFALLFVVINVLDHLC